MERLFSVTYFSTSLKLDHLSVHYDLPCRAAIARCHSTPLRNIETLHIPNVCSKSKFTQRLESRKICYISKSASQRVTQRPARKHPLTVERVSVKGSTLAVTQISLTSSSKRKPCLLLYTRSCRCWHRMQTFEKELHFVILFERLHFAHVYANSSCSSFSLLQQPP